MSKKQRQATGSNGLDATAEVAGSAIGGAIGALAAGPVGGAVGGAVGPLVTRGIRSVARELQRRILGPREDERVATALFVAAERIEARLKAGELPRQDEFFEASANERSAAEEIAEGILLTAQREYEERKLPYEGNLLAAIPFDAYIDRPLANYLIRQIRQLSYRQLRFLSFLSRLDEFEIPWENDIGKLKHNSVQIVREDLIHEVNDLGGRGFIETKDAIAFKTHFSPRYYKITDVGRAFIRLTELRSMPTEELHDLVRLFTPGGV